MRRPWHAALLMCALGACGVDDPDRSTDTGNALTISSGLVHYSANQTLSASFEPVMVVGSAGALSRAGGTLTVENTSATLSATTTVINPDRSFFAIVAGRISDTVRLTYDEGAQSTEYQLALSDGLAMLAAPTVGGTGVPFLSDTGGGVFRVDVSDVLGATPPCVVFNRTTGAVLLLSSSNSGQLMAASGETVCVFNLDAGAQSPTYCETVP